MAFQQKMGESSNQGSTFVPPIVSEILREVSMIQDFSQKSSKLDFCIQSFEEEVRKVEGFKRELPLCMHLLNDAIDTLKKERGRGKEPMMEEFIPLKSGISEADGRAKLSKDLIEKKNWMSSVQLWSTPVQYESSFVNRNRDPFLSLKSRYHQEEDAYAFESPVQLGWNLKSRGGAFVPFKKQLLGVTIKEDEKRTAPVLDGLSLSVPVVEVEPTDSHASDEFAARQPQEPDQRQPRRKQRRCWSSELHQHFVDALHKLGGVKTATPKQIRELMKVEGLTNDEVKSHLQKYRIHVRKLHASGDLSWLMHGLPGKMVANSGSPLDHLHQAGSSAQAGGSGSGTAGGSATGGASGSGAAGGSATGGGGSATGGDDSMEEDGGDGKSETHSWKQHF